MTQNFIKLLTTSLLASAFIFAGCGGDTQNLDGVNAHQVNIKKPRADENLPDVDIWHKYVDISSVYDENNEKMRIKVDCNRGISPDVHTYQVYIDSDQNSQTGFSAGESSWEIKGADYLIEDDALFKSISDTEWKWEWIRDVSVSKYGSKTEDYNIEYTLNSDTVKEIFEDNLPDKVNISIEPVNRNWQDTHNYVSIQNVDVLDDVIKITKDELKKMIKNGEDVTQVDVSGIMDMSGLFDMTSFNQPIGDWNVSNVVNMHRMFLQAEDFNQDISNWDVSNVTDMAQMFYGTKAFNQPIGNWDVSNVTNMLGMFAGARVFNQPIGDWNVSNVNGAGMHEMFDNARAFNQPIGKWDVSNVTNMSTMFYSAEAFNQDISNWNVSNVSGYSNFSSFSSLQESYKPNFAQ